MYVLWKKTPKAFCENPEFYHVVAVGVSLNGLYQYYNQMKHFGHYTTFEVDDMMPFEREIKLGLLSDTIKKQRGN